MHAPPLLFAPTRTRATFSSLPSHSHAPHLMPSLPPTPTPTHPHAFFFVSSCRGAGRGDGTAVRGAAGRRFAHAPAGGCRDAAPGGARARRNEPQGSHATAAAAAADGAAAAAAIMWGAAVRSEPARWGAAERASLRLVVSLAPPPLLRGPLPGAPCGAHLWLHIFWGRARLRRARTHHRCALRQRAAGGAGRGADRRRINPGLRQLRAASGRRHARAHLGVKEGDSQSRVRELDDAVATCMYLCALSW